MERRGRRATLSARMGRTGRLVSCLLAGALAVTGLAAGLTVVPAQRAVAAPAGCGYADNSPNNGKFASTICWFDFSAFDATQARTAEGQTLQIALDGGLLADFTVKVTNLPSTVPMNFEKRSTPLESRFAFGTDAYRGVPGLNALYSLGSPAGNKAATITFENIRVTDAQGDPVAGYSFVAADAEDNVARESFRWTSDKPLNEIERLAPNGGWGCKSPTGLGTTSVSCAGTGVGGTTEAGGKSTALLVAADSPRTFATTWVTPNRSAIAIGIQTAKLSVVKQVSSRVAPEDSFQVTATNASGVVIGQGETDTANTGSTGALVVAPGATYTVGESPAAGSPTNLSNYNATWSCMNAAVGSGTVLPSGPGLTQAVVPSAGDDITCTVTNTAKASMITLEKIAGAPVDVNGNGIPDAGDTIAYSFTVTNTGQTAVESVAVNDPKVGSVTCPDITVAPTSSMTCTANTSYVITSEDVVAGAVDNTATATAHPIGSPAVITSNSSSTSTPTVPPAPAVTLVKSASPSNSAAYVEGQVITYTFVVSNTGNVPLENIAIDDSEFSGTGTLSPLTCPPGFGALSPNTQATCTATYTLTLPDVNAGGLENAAVATADPIDADPVTSRSEIRIPVEPAASIVLTKRATPATASRPGDVITYEFDITNTGNVSLSAPSVTETAFSGTGTRPVPACPSVSFIPGEMITCTATYTLTQTDVNAGTVSNTATASAVAPSGANPVSLPSTVAVTIPANPSLTISKTGTLEGEGVAGDLINYSFEVTNAGNVTIEDVAIAETEFSGTGEVSTITCDSTALGSGGSTFCSATYALTQSDVNVGIVTNTAVATGIPTGTTTDVVSLPDAVEIETLSMADISLAKSVTSDPVTAAGEVVTYSFVVTNTGTVDLANPTVTETAFTGSGPVPAVTCPPAVLAPNDTITCTTSYTVTQADIDTGSFMNTATATAIAPSGIAAPVSDPSLATVTIGPAPALTVVKSASPSGEAGFVAGEVVTYSFVVTNTGNVTLEDVTVEESEFTGAGALPAPTCDTAATSLAPGAQVVCETQYTLTQEDIDAGSVTNAATATADPPGPTPPLRSPVARVSIPELAAPSLTLVKATDTESISAVSQTVDYTFTVTNSGNTVLRELAIVEESFSGVGHLPSVVCRDDELLPGQITVCTTSYRVQEGDLTGEPLTNTATAAAATVGGAPVASAPSTALVDDVLKLPTGQMASTGGGSVWGLATAAACLVAVGGAMLLLIARRKRRTLADG